MTIAKSRRISPALAKGRPSLGVLSSKFFFMLAFGEKPPSIAMYKFSWPLRLCHDVPDIGSVDLFLSHLGWGLWLVRATGRERRLGMILLFVLFFFLISFFVSYLPPFICMRHSIRNDTFEHYGVGISGFCYSLDYRPLCVASVLGSLEQFSIVFFSYPSLPPPRTFIFSSSFSSLTLYVCVCVCVCVASSDTSLRA